MISNGRSRNIWKSDPSRRRPKEKISSTSLYRRNLAIIGRGAVLLLRRFDRRCTRWISTLRPLRYPRSLSNKLLRTSSVSSSPGLSFEIKVLGYDLVHLVVEFLLTLNQRGNSFILLVNLIFKSSRYSLHLSVLKLQDVFRSAMSVLAVA